MLTSLCAIAALVSVGHNSQLRTIFLIWNDTKVLISPYSFLHAFFYFLERRRTHGWVISRRGRSNSVSVYCNSLLATLNVRDAILRKGNDNAGISLPTIGGSSLSTADIYKVDGLVCLPPSTIINPPACSGNHLYVRCRKLQTYPRD